MPQIITLYTNLSTTLGNVLHFANVPVKELQYGSTVTGYGIPAGTYVTEFTSTTITVSSIVSVFYGEQIVFTSNTGSVLNISSDYKIKVPSGGTIRLDTGTNIGQVFITGNLNVQGNTTTVNTTNMNIEDNIILLNNGENGYQVTLGISGIEIDRGTNTYGNAQFLWDETKSWFDPWTATTRYGLWEFRTKAFNNINGILTNSIDTMGNSLALISKGTGTITVTGTDNYERQILNYNNQLEALDDDLIPNIKAVNDKIYWSIFNLPSDKIRVDDTEVIAFDNNITQFIKSYNTNNILTNNIELVHTFISNEILNVWNGKFITITNSNVSQLNGTWPVTTALSNSQSFVITILAPVALSNVPTTGTVTINDAKSNVQVKIDGIRIAEFQQNHTDVFGIRIEDTTISTTTSNTDLILISEGTGSVQIQDNLKLANVGIGFEPSNPPSGNLKIYSNPEGPGGTGIYFVNDHYAQNVGDNRRDELISKKKAIAFAILM